MNNRERYPECWEMLSALVIERAGYVCEICGKGRAEGKVLQACHIDQDPENNAPSNLISACKGDHLNFIDKGSNTFKRKYGYDKRQLFIYKKERIRYENLRTYQRA